VCKCMAYILRVLVSHVYEGTTYVGRNVSICIHDDYAIYICNKTPDSNVFLNLLALWTYGPKNITYVSGYVHPYVPMYVNRNKNYYFSRYKTTGKKI
jgi:hypothetical protein